MKDKAWNERAHGGNLGSVHWKPDFKIFKNKLGQDLRKGAAIWIKTWVEDGSFFHETWCVLI